MEEFVGIVVLGEVFLWKVVVVVLASFGPIGNLVRKVLSALRCIGLELNLDLIGMCKELSDNPEKYDSEVLLRFMNSLGEVLEGNSEIRN